MTLQIHPKVDMLDKSISIAIVLFILSMISERVVTWFKLQFGRKGGAFPLFSIADEDLTTKNLDPELEKKRERKILGLNLVISIIVALAARADFFAILNSEPPYLGVGWGDVNGYQTNFGLVLLGCVFTGFFISLGSKFWHDTLDMLFYAKNLKGKLANPNSYTVQSIEELDEFIELTDRQIAQLAKEKYEQEFLGLGAKEVWVGYNPSFNAATLHVAIENITNWNSIRKQVRVQLPKSGKVVNVPIEVIITGEVVANDGPGHRIYNSTAPNRGGTWGCIVQSTVHDTIYLLSCYHVLKADTHLMGWLNVAKDIAISSNDYGKIGNLEMGNINEDVDAGLASDIDIKLFDNYIPALGKKIVDSRPITDGDEANRTTVRFKGMTKSTMKEGKIIFIKRSPTIKYTTNKGDYRQQINNLIAISEIRNGTRYPVSVPGDSGALVVDTDGKALGIIVASDDVFSYAVPIERILSKYKLKIYDHVQESV